MDGEVPFLAVASYNNSTGASNNTILRYRWGLVYDPPAVSEEQSVFIATNVRASSMKVSQLIEILQRFDPESAVRLGMSPSSRILETYEQLWVGDYGGGPQINVAPDVRVFQIYVGCGWERMLGVVPPRRQVDLGRYQSSEDSARVRDFYVINQGLQEPLAFPDFDYDHWIPPRTNSGQYHPVIARILRDKLMGE